MEDTNIEGILEETADIMDHFEDITGLDMGYIAEIMEKTTNIARLPQLVVWQVIKYLGIIVKPLLLNVSLNS